MRAALICTKLYFDTVENINKSRYEVDKIVDVTNELSLNDLRVNFDYTYAIIVNDDVQVGMIYDEINSTIYDVNGNQIFPSPTTEQLVNDLNNKVNKLTYNVNTDELTLDELKEYLIRKNKNNLSNYLYEHPMYYNGKKYTITEDKQNQLTGLLNAYTYAKAIGQEIPLSWNETGGVCEPYTFEELVALYLTMLSVVKPIVTYQQHQEISIRQATTKELALAVDISFDNIDTDI